MNQNSLNMAKTIQEQIYEPGGLRKYLVPNSIYCDGAIAMLLRLREYSVLEEPHSNGKSKAEDKIYNKAIIDMLLSSKDNIERFLFEDFDEIRFSDHQRDKKNKLVKCKAYLAKRITTYKEL